MGLIWSTGLDGRQLTYLCALLAVSLVARNGVAAIMWINAVVILSALAASDAGRIAHAQAMIYGAAGDVACGAALMWRGGLGRLVGYLYFPVAALTLVGMTLGYASYQAYVIAYVIGYIQLAVVWVGNGRDGLDSGGGRGYRGNRGDGRRLLHRDGGVAMGADAMAARMAEVGRR